MSEGASSGKPVSGPVDWLRESDQVRLFLDISQAMTSTLELDELYGIALDRLHDLIPFVGAVIGVKTPAGWMQGAARRPAEIGEGTIQRLPGWGRSEWMRDISAGKAFIVEDIRGDDPKAVEYRAHLPVPIEQSSMRYFRSIMEVPISLNGETVGEISVSHEEPGFFTTAHMNLVSAVGSYLVIAMENARLYSEARERAQDLSTLLDLSRSVTSTLKLDELYETALDRLQDLIPYVGASIGLRTNGERQQVAARRPAEIGPNPLDRRPGWHESEFMTRVAQGEWSRIDDIRGEEPLAVEYRSYFDVPVEESPVRYFRSILSVPLIAQGRVIGDLAIAHEQPRYFNAGHVDLALSVANHIAIAVENARLYASAEDRANAMAAVLDLSRAVTSTLDLETLYEVAFDRLREMIPYTGASVGLNTPAGPRQVAARRPSPISANFIARREGWAESGFMRSLGAGKSVLIRDVRSEEPFAVEYRNHLTVPIEESEARYFRSVLAVPLRIGANVIGDMGVVHETANYFTAEHEEIVTTVANHVSVAIQNARLYAEAQERTREMASLLQVSRSVAGSHDTEALAALVLDEFRNVMDFGNASLVLRDGDYLRIAYANSKTDPAPRRDVIGVTFEIANAGPIWDQLANGQPLLVDDNRDGGYWSQAYQEIVGDLYDTAFAQVRSWLGVPLVVRNETIGFLTISAPQPRQFRQEHVDLAMAFAAQVSVAFENAELVQQAQSVAANEERQRLARELHDSVSQALYGIALGARTARTQLDRDATAAVEPIDYVLSLAEAGLAEMRALIFELRPESLANEGLVAALEKQVAATRARYGLTIELATEGEPDLPIRAKEAFYRIAQEALHNVVKHARATRVRVALGGSSARTELTVEDNGDGFDTRAEFPGHLGLQSMRERAGSIGAAVDVSSQPGTGTTVRLTL